MGTGSIGNQNTHGKVDSCRAGGGTWQPRKRADPISFRERICCEPREGCAAVSELRPCPSQAARHE